MFEGTEKKLEIVARTGGDLRGFGRPFWDEVVRASRAQILSSVHSDALDAYLLSESSLFVWHDRALMITCGTTRLVDAAERIVERVGGAEALEFLSYERKNEVFPHQQPTHFIEDAARLARLVPGQAFQFGPEDEHHLFLFHLDRPCTTPDAEVTAELLMCGLSGPARERFGVRRSGSGLESVLDGFEVDEHWFDPQGFSLNAVRGDRYATLHVTPEERGSYASFETNAWTASELPAVMRRVLEVFQPRAFDLIAWDRDDPLGAVDLGAPERRTVVQRLSNGYRLRMSSYAAEEPGVSGAMRLVLPS